MAEFNVEVVIPTLRMVVDMLNRNHIEYRFIGSVVAAGTNGKLHRNLGDIDLIIDEKGKDVLYNELTKFGYYLAGGMFAFARKYLALETMRHAKYSEVGFFYGRWQSDGSIVMGGNRVNVSIDANALTPTKYTLHGVSFIGINPKAALTRIWASRANPKRAKELIFFKEKGITPFSDTFIHVNVFGQRFDWIYHLVLGFQNFAGRVRLLFGLTFDPWR